MGHEKEDLSGYLDGAVTDAERGRIEAHLKDCAECRAELEDLRKVCGMVKGLPQKPLPTGFLQRLENRRKQEARTEGWASLLAPRNVAWAACAVTVIFVTYQSVSLRAPMDVQSAAAPSLAPAAPADTDRPLELLSTADLVAKGKEQKRAEGIAALRGADAGAAGISAAGLAAPAAPRGFGGSAIGEAPPAKSAYTNEALQKHLEAERARLGIQRIVTPNSVVRALKAAARDLAPAAGPSFEKEAVPVPMVGQTSTLLARPQGAGRGAAEGALVPPADFSGTRAPTKPKKEGVPLFTAAPQETGRAVYSMEETTLLWREQGLPGAVPRVDFSQSMLVVLFAQARIESVVPAADRIVVSFRPLDSTPRPEQRWRVVPRSDLPVVFQPVP